MPGLALEIWRFHEKHRLHAFDAAIPVRQMRARDLAEDSTNLWMSDVFLDNGTDEMRLMDAEDILHCLPIANRGGKRLDGLAGIFTTGQGDDILPHLFDLAHRDQLGRNQVTLLDKKGNLIRA